LKELNITKDRFGNDLTPYSLRHYAITEALGRGVPMNLLEDQYQTSAAMIKRHYGHLLHTSKSAEILKGLV
jgi:integrase